MRRHRASVPPRRTDSAAVVSTSDITLSGTIRPQHITAVTSTVSGNVEAFMADVGDEVYQGQVLARIGAAGLESEREAAAHAVEYAQEQVGKAETAVTAARLEASRASADAQRSQMALERAEKSYSRQKTLNEVGATPRLTYEKAEQDYQNQRQEMAVMDKAVRASGDSVQSALDQVASAKKVLADKSREMDEAQGAFEAAEVRAPVDGLVVERKGEVGKPVGESGGELFQIATDIYALELSVEPQPPDLKRLQPGQPALVSIPDLSAGGLPGAVKEIKDTHVIVEFTSTIPAIKPGMRADVRLKLE
jgi:HlyD family secretion protein